MTSEKRPNRVNGKFDPEKDEIDLGSGKKRNPNARKKSTAGSKENHGLGDSDKTVFKGPAAEYLKKRRAKLRLKNEK